MASKDGQLQSLRQRKQPTSTSQAMPGGVLAVILYEGAVFNAIFLRLILPAVGKRTLVATIFVVFNSLFGLVLWSFFRACSADAGTIPDRWQEFVLSEGDKILPVPPEKEWQPGRVIFCKLCSATRPERAHHCAECDHCVLRMDHHCPWINNCVGFGNHKYFLLLVGYAWLTAIVALGTSLPALTRCMMHLQRVLLARPPPVLTRIGEEELQTRDFAAFLVFGLLALGIASVLTPIVCTHWPQAVRDLTTIERNYTNMLNPYDRGLGIVANLEQVFGECGADWLLPVAPWRPLSDGISFARQRSPPEHNLCRGLVRAGDS